MKVLFICTSIDRTLQKQILALQKQGHHVDILDILEYKLLFDSGKVIHIRPKTKYKMLENFFVLDEINETIRRKEIFDYLDRYDLVDIYKCSNYAVEFQNKISKISFKYTVTIHDVFPEKSSKLDELLTNAKAIFFQNKRLQNSFNIQYGYKEKSIALYKPLELLEKYDNIEKDIYNKFLDFLKINKNKTNVFCHFNGMKHKQKELLLSLINLPLEIKTKSTFLIYLANEEKNINNEIILTLQEYKLDYVLIQQDTTKEQLAMLLKVSSASIFINHLPLNTTLLASIYAKNFVFIFKGANIDPFFKENKIFLDSFDDFLAFYDKDDISKNIYKEILKQNKHKIYSIFSYESFEKKFLEATLI